MFISFLLLTQFFSFFFFTALVPAYTWVQQSIAGYLRALRRYYWLSGWAYAYRKGGLVADDMPVAKSEEVLKRNLAKPFAALLTMSFTFAGPISWELSWFIPVYSLGI